MMVMIANNSGKEARALAAKYPGIVGHLYGPGSHQKRPVPGFPYAFDNNRFAAWKNKTEWDESKWLTMMRWGVDKEPRALWAVVPDVVADKAATLVDWAKYRDIVQGHGYPLAFAVQDGMVASDVPPDADIVFVGGTTEWKWKTMRGWCADFPSVHVARVNTYRLLYKAADAGAKSGDGTGFCRGDQRQKRDLYAFCAEQFGAKKRVIQERLFEL